MVIPKFIPVKVYRLFFSSSKRLVRSSKSTSSPPAELAPKVSLGGAGRLLIGTAGRSGKESIGFPMAALGLCTGGLESLYDGAGWLGYVKGGACLVSELLPAGGTEGIGGGGYADWGGG